MKNNPECESLQVFLIMKPLKQSPEQKKQSSVWKETAMNLFLAKLSKENTSNKTFKIFFKWFFNFILLPWFLVLLLLVAVYVFLFNQFY